MSSMNHVLFNYVVDGVVVDGPMPYQTVLARTGLKDTVGFTAAGYMEHFEPQPVIEITQQQFLTALRAQRDFRLQQSDWTQMPDTPLDAELKALWSEYRQALRDMPAANPNIVSLDDIVWPQAPA
jgi:hypothetical protein